MGKNSQPRDNDDDAAEGRADSRQTVPLRAPRAEQQEQAATVDSPARADGDATLASEGTEEQPAKKVRLSGAQKKALARAKKEEEWQARQAAKAAAKAAGGDGATGGAEGDDGAGGKKKGKGQNKVSCWTIALLGAEVLTRFRCAGPLLPSPSRCRGYQALHQYFQGEGMRPRRRLPLQPRRLGLPRCPSRRHSILPPHHLRRPHSHAHRPRLPCFRQPRILRVRLQVSVWSEPHAQGRGGQRTRRQRLGAYR